jgi:Succinylglutamate desuccinylase / Aspartoacylase family
VALAWSLGMLAPPAVPAAEPVDPATTAVAGDYTADGRLPLAQLMARFATLSGSHGWTGETVYAYPDTPGLEIKAWRTPRQGPALWILSGIHGEEPAGPNAIARNLDSLVRLAGEGVPIVLVPLANPNAYRHNWRYPNTPERDWKLGGGYSVGDSEYLLPDLETGTKPREPAASGPETAALTQYVLQLAQSYPPRLVLDLHEDELSTSGGYIYSQGTQPDGNPVGAEIVRLLQATGIPLRRSGQTRFGETIVDGVISRDDAGRPIRDGSIDELLAATEIIRDGRKLAGPAAQTVIVVETPAFEGSQFELRVAAQGAVVQHARELWEIGGHTPTGDATRPASPPAATAGP